MQKRIKLPEVRINYPPDTIKYIVALIILAVPLYPKFPFLSIPGTYVSVRLEDFIIAISAVVWLFVLYPKYKQILAQKIPKAIILYLFVGLISLVFAAFITQTINLQLGLLHWLRRIEYFTPFFLGMLAIKLRKENLAYFIKLLMIVIVIASVFGFGQRHLSWPIITTQNQEYSKGIALRWVPGSHVNATFAGHYDLATFLILTLPIVISAFFLVKNNKTRVYLGLTVFPGLWLLVNTASRISIVSYLLAVTVSLILIRKYKVIPIVLIISILFFSISAKHLMERYLRIFDVTRIKIEEFVDKVSFQHGSVYAADEITLPARREKSTPEVTQQEVFEDRSTSIRLNIEWPRAIRAFTKNPLLGTGYSSITLATDNDYLRLLGETGLLGFLAFALIFVRLAKLAVKTFPLRERFSGIELAFLAGYIGSLPGILLNAVFIDVFEASKFAIMFWLLTGVASGLILRKSDEKSI